MLFRKDFKVFTNSYESLIVVKLVINGRLFSKINCVMQPDGVLLIGDIPPFEKNRDYGKGYGSMMMSELIRHATEIGVHTIHGNLSLIDSDHKNRLHAFYKKHGFEIIEYENPKGFIYGEVVKNIVR